VIDAYGDPKAESDLAEYRSNYGIAPCTTKNGCFLKIAGNGSTKKFPPLSEGWAGEESLDVDMVSAICPKCHIILVEAVTNSFADFEAAERIGVEHGATVISNSWGGNEYAAADAAYDHPGVAITASAGDNGYDTCAAKCAGPQDPAAFSSVIAVGGTTMLPSAATARGFTETAWNCYNDAPRACDASTIYATGSGCASRAPIPAWQSGTGCTMRAYNDVSAVADVTTGVHIYDSYYGGWLVYGGTSVASPIVASAIALAGNAAKLHGAESMWRSHGKGLNDITSGDNVIPKGHGAFPRTCLPAYPEICTAGPGFDGPTGWGTPNGLSGL
jgi:subtilase family serine protease